MSYAQIHEKLYCRVHQKIFRLRLDGELMLMEEVEVLDHVEYIDVEVIYLRATVNESLDTSSTSFQSKDREIPSKILHVTTRYSILCLFLGDVALSYISGGRELTKRSK